MTQLYPGVPPALERAVMRALEKEPDKRFQNLAEMRRAIVGGQADPQPEDDPTTLIPRPGAPQPERAVNVVTDSERFAETGVTPAPRAQAPTPDSSSCSCSYSHPAPARAATQEKGRNRRETRRLDRDTTGGRGRHATTADAAARAFSETGRGRRLRRGRLVLAAAAAIPWLLAEPQSDLERELPGIEEAMGRFRTAYRNRNLEGVTEMFPTLPGETRQAMQRSFSDCLVYEVTFADMRVELEPTDATQAQVDVRSTHICTPNSGGRQIITGQHDVFTLRKSGDGWRIDGAVQAPDASADRTQ